jgi:hypothetical protein
MRSLVNLARVIYTQGSLNAAMGDVEGAVVALGAAYQQTLVAYGIAKSETFVVERASDLASSIGPDRFNEAIFGCMLAHGLAPLLERTAMRADRQPNANLASASAAFRNVRLLQRASW